MGTNQLYYILIKKIDFEVLCDRTRITLTCLSADSFLGCIRILMLLSAAYDLLRYKNQIIFNHRNAEGIISKKIIF